MQRYELPRLHRQGFSLVELIVTFSLTLIVVAISLYFFSQSNYSSENLAKQQNLMNESNRLLRLLKKDIRSATEAAISYNGIRLRTNFLSKSGVPETKIVEYLLSEGAIVRKEGELTKSFTFSTMLKPDDYLSLSITHNSPAGSGFFLEIFAINSGGIELIRIKERLLKIEMTKP